MSDVSGAPAESEPAPVVDEVVAPPSPVDTAPPTPEPVKDEPKPAEKPAPKDEKPLSSRDALKAAAERVEKEAKDKPDSKPKPVEAGPARDETGKFAPKEGEKPAEKPVQADPAKPAPVEAPKPAASAHAAPVRFSPDAKAVWETAPEPVRAEVARMEREMSQGLEKYKADATEFESVRPFHEMAKQSGTTLAQAMSNYVNMEKLIRSDPGRGFLELCKNAGIDPKKMGEFLSGQQTEGGDAPETAGLKGQSQALQQRIDQLEAQIGELKSAPVQAQVQEFASKNPLFHLLSNDIAQELQGMRERGETPDLPRAYEAAKQKYPELAAAHTPAPAQIPPEPSKVPAPAPAAHTDKGTKSIAGAPTPGSDPVSRQPSSSIKDALRRAAAQAG